MGQDGTGASKASHSGWDLPAGRGFPFIFAYFCGLSICAAHDVKMMWEAYLFSVSKSRCLSPLGFAFNLKFTEDENFWPSRVTQFGRGLIWL